MNHSEADIQQRQQALERASELWADWLAGPETAVQQRQQQRAACSSAIQRLGLLLLLFKATTTNTPTRSLVCGDWQTRTNSCCLSLAAARCCLLLQPASSTSSYQQRPRQQQRHAECVCVRLSRQPQHLGCCCCCTEMTSWSQGHWAGQCDDVQRLLLAQQRRRWWVWTDNALEPFSLWLPSCSGAVAVLAAAAADLNATTSATSHRSRRCAVAGKQVWHRRLARKQQQFG